MKLGLGLYKHMLTRENYAFARQCGATHVAIHMVDYFNHDNNSCDNQPTGGQSGWGRAGNPDVLWSLDEILQIKSEINKAGLVLEAIENFDPSHWYDILLDGPRKQSQIEKVKTIIRTVGRAGIPVFGYNFSIAGVCGRITGPFARGGAMSVGMDGIDDTPIQAGMAWNMVYDPDASEGKLEQITHDQLWERYAEFLKEILPAAEKAGVTMALHPDDPPAAFMRKQPRLVYQPKMYDRVIEIDRRPVNQFEFCIGTLAEMTEGDIYETVDLYSRQRRIAYIHLRNIKGKVPRYHETFIDEGDIDIRRVLSILKDNHFDGMIIPDHTPQMSCSGPWHAGMSYALGYIKGLIEGL